MSTRTEIRFAGKGGQGLVTVAFVLGRSLSLTENKHVTGVSNYGPEARGGLAYSDLVVSDEEIDYPKVQKPNILVCLSNESFEKFQNDFHDIIIIDPDVVDAEDVEESIKKRMHKIRATVTAEQLGTKQIANVVILGALTAMTGIAKQEALEDAIRTRWPRFVELNISALRKGMELGRKSMEAKTAS